MPQSGRLLCSVCVDHALPLDWLIVSLGSLLPLCSQVGVGLWHDLLPSCRWLDGVFSNVCPTIGHSGLAGWSIFEWLPDLWMLPSVWMVCFGMPAPGRFAWFPFTHVVLGGSGQF